MALCTLELSKKRAYEWYVETHLGLSESDVEEALDEALEPSGHNAVIVLDEQAAGRDLDDDELQGLIA